MHHIRTASCGIWILFLSINSQVVLADSVLEEIVVTAQKREQAIQDVGIAISAFSGTQLEKLGYDESTELVRMIAGVNLSRSSAAQHVMFNVRGVTQVDYGDSAEAPIAVYVDEAYTVTTQGARFALFDMERVEVLKGPQGTLFGRNATGGLVHYITKKPTDEFEAFTNLTYGSYDETKFDGAVSGPLSDNVNARLSAYFSRHDEILENLLPGADDEWNENIYAARAQLAWDVNDKVDFWISAFGGRENISTGPYQSYASIQEFDEFGNPVNSFDSSPTETRTGFGPGGVATCPTCFFGSGIGFPDVRPVPGGDAFGVIDPDGFETAIVKDFAFDRSNKYDVAGLTARITWQLGDMELVSITDYKYYNKENYLDIDSTQINASIFPAFAKTDQISEEIRLSGERDRSRWVVGLYYLTYDIDDIRTGLRFPAVTAGGPQVTPGLEGAELTVFADASADSISLFGQVDYDLTDKLTLVTGLRFIDDSKDYNHVNSLVLVPSDVVIVPDLVPGANVSLHSSDSLWSGKIQLEWSPNDDLLIYGGLNRGSKGGGFNQNVTAAAPPPPFIYEPEVLLAYETGFKSTLGGNKTLNGSIYYYDYDDVQAFRFLARQNFIENVDGKYFGGELEFTANPVEGLDLMLGVAYVDATMEDVPFATGPGGTDQLLIDRTPPFTPEITASGMARYQWTLASAATFAIQADFNYADSYFGNVTNYASTETKSYVIGNARLSYTSANERWGLEFFVNNIADEIEYEEVGFDLSTVCGCSLAAFGKPRWFGATFRYNWH